MNYLKCEYAGRNYFVTPDKDRKFEIIVEDYSLWVNEKELILNSPVFEALIIQLHEQQAVKETIICTRLKKKTYNDMHEFFSCLFTCPNRKPINYDNFSLIMKLSDEYGVKELMDRCRLFLGYEIEQEKLFKRGIRFLLEKEIFQSCYSYTSLFGLWPVFIPKLSSLPAKSLAPFINEFPAYVLLAMYNTRKDFNFCHPIKIASLKFEIKRPIEILRTFPRHFIRFVCSEMKTLSFWVLLFALLYFYHVIRAERAATDDYETNFKICESHLNTRIAQYSSLVIKWNELVARFEREC